MEKSMIVRVSEPMTEYAWYVYNTRKARDKTFEVYNVLCQASDCGYVPTGEFNRNNIRSIAMDRAKVSETGYYKAIKRLKALGLVESIKDIGFKVVGFDSLSKKDGIKGYVIERER